MTKSVVVIQSSKTRRGLLQRLTQIIIASPDVCSSSSK